MQAGCYAFDMAELASLYGYLEFQRSVRGKTRYVHDEQAREFLRTVLDTTRSGLKKLRNASILYRAQRGFTWTIERHGEPRRKTEGRVAPTQETL